jgi:undecaprenyl diphosphate synthase
MQFASIPKTLALIPDGNRRWANMHRLSVLQGYKLGVQKFIDFSEWCREYGVNNLTVWALSSENVKRSPYEVKALFSIYRHACKDRKILGRLEELGIHVNMITNRSILPKDLVASLHGVEKKTENNSEGVINMLIGYGGKDDLLFGARKFAGLVRRGYDASAEAFKNCLLSYQVPDIDFVIRTSGERRLSGFMPWQLNYAELYFSRKLWPDFARADLQRAMAEYNRRSRRFGR